MQLDLKTLNTVCSVVNLRVTVCAASSVPEVPCVKDMEVQVVTTNWCKQMDSPPTTRA